MRPWLIGAVIALLIVAGLGFQILQAPTVSENHLAQAIFKYDLLIKNAVIIDGTGADRYYGSIGILDDQIISIGPTLSGWAKRVIDAKGLYAAPGFVDLGVLGQLNDHKLLMGVTTQVIRSLQAPIRSEPAQGSNFAWLFDYEQLFDLVSGGTGSITDAQFKELTERIAVALRSGASGVYVQGSSLSAALLRGSNTHWSTLDAEDSRLFWQMPIDDQSALDMVTGLLARASSHQVPIHLSGVNLSHPLNWGRVYDVINLIDRGTSGTISGDVVPYFEQPLVAERDLKVFISHPAIAIASGVDSLHPAVTGTYPRLLERFVNQESILSIEEAINKSTLLPASVLGLTDRGVLREGYSADIVLFDGTAINTSSASAVVPSVAPGIHTVLVNGKVAIEAGKVTGARSGVILSHKATP